MRDQGNERVVEAKRRKKKAKKEEKKEEKKEGEWTRKKKAERKACKVSWLPVATASNPRSDDD